MAYFKTPAEVSDFTRPDSYVSWSDTIAKMVRNNTDPQAILQQKKVPRTFKSQFFNQLDHQDWVVSPAEVHWNGFPKRILQDYNGNQIQAWSNADNPQLLKKSVFSRYPGYRDQYIRVQDEYLEWFVHRNDAGKITRIDLTAEGPEYWAALHKFEENTCVALYQQYISPDVKAADLKFNDKYNPQNKWNTTLGCMHLCCPPNSLGAEVALGAQATAIRKDPAGNIITSSQSLITCSGYGEPTRNSDPAIGSAVNGLARQGLSLSLENPIGLYISFIDTTGWTYQGEQLSDEQLNRIVVCQRGTRGTLDAPGKGLRYKISVPEDMGFDLGDITINASPLKYGGQIASVTTIHLTAISSPSGPGVQQAFPCVGSSLAAAMVAPADLNAEALSMADFLDEEKIVSEHDDFLQSFSTKRSMTSRNCCD